MKYDALFVLPLLWLFSPGSGFADSNSAPYNDPEGLFSFSPPPGWQLVVDPGPNISASRKIVFRPLSADASLTIILDNDTKRVGPSGSASLPTYPQVQEKQSIGEDDSYVDENGVMHVTTVSGSSPRTLSYEFLAGATHYTIKYKASPPSYEQYGTEVMKSIGSFRPAEAAKDKEKEDK